MVCSWPSPENISDFFLVFRVVKLSTCNKLKLFFNLLRFVKEVVDDRPVLVEKGNHEFVSLMKVLDDVPLVFFLSVFIRLKDRDRDIWFCFVYLMSKRP